MARANSQDGGGAKMITHSRREFLAAVAGFGAIEMLAMPASAEEGPPETTTIRLGKNSNLCLAPLFVAEDLLRAEGFKEIQYVAQTGGLTLPEMVAQGDVDLSSAFAATTVYHLDAGLPLVVFGGLHAGCYELFAHEGIRTVTNLKGRRVAIQTMASSAHLYLSIIAAHVGLDPLNDIHWVIGRNSVERFAQHEVDAFLAFPPEPQELRSRNIGRTIIRTTVDPPWSQYFCCMVFSNREFLASNPVATKRVLRALLKASDFCATNPAAAAQGLVDGQFTKNYEHALEAVRDIPYTAWREFDAVDSFRFYALRLREIGMIKSNPNELIASGMDKHFFDELKRELKA
jgi:NitT/TauT family transport system substrate-binding protein